MRSYGEYWSIARALDVVGDRWTFLIIRELLISGAGRYTDLKDGLPGIASNLLADRIGDLETAGLVQRGDAPPPVATTLFSLTQAGGELRPVLDALSHWGVRYMTGPADGDEFRGHWASFFRHETEFCCQARGSGGGQPGRPGAAEPASQARPSDVSRSMASPVSPGSPAFTSNPSSVCR